MVDWVLVVCGGLIVTVGLLDVFLTVLHYEDLGFLSNRLYRWMWEVLRRATAVLPDGMRASARSLGGPLMVSATLILWIGLEIMGFALLFFAGMDGENFALASQLEPDFLGAIYYSVVTVATLGYGDITPISPFYQMLAALGTLIGFSLFSLGTTYVLGVYRVLERMSILEMSIYHQVEESDKPLSVLECHFPRGEARDLGFLLRDFHQGIEAYYNGILRYPVVYFFYSRRVYRSSPFAFRTIGYVAAGLKWGLPDSHPATREPALHPLVVGFDLTTTQIKDRIAISNENAPPEPADFADFSAALAGEKEPEDCGLGRFVEAEQFMRRLARVEEVPEPEEAYDRYKQWLLFIHRVDSFVELLAEDLGYDLDALRDRPGKPLSS